MTSDTFAHTGDIRRRMWDVFVSHAREDSVFAQMLAVRLSDASYSVRLGSQLASDLPLREVESAINSSGIVIVLLSQASLSSRWIQREVTFALDVLPSRYVIPIAVGQVDVRNLPRWLNNRKWMHLRHESQLERLMGRLLPLLETALGRSESPSQELEHIIGVLPPRVPLVGVEENLRLLSSKETGLTLIVGAPGSGKTSLAREYAARVASHFDFTIWWSSRPGTASTIVDEIETALHGELEKRSSQGHGLIVVDELDAFSFENSELWRYLHACSAGHRVLTTTRKLPKLDFGESDYSVLTIGSLTREAFDDYINVVSPDIGALEHVALARAADAFGASPMLLRHAVELLMRGQLGSDFLAARTRDEIIQEFLRLVLQELTEGQRDRLYILSFCDSLLTVIREDDQWRVPIDTSLFERLLAWGICIDYTGSLRFASDSMVDCLRRTSPRKASEAAIAYVRSRLPDPADSHAESFLACVAGLTELSEVSWVNAAATDLAELLIWQSSFWRSANESSRAEDLCERVLTLASQQEETTLLIRAMNLKSALAYDQRRIVEASAIERETLNLAHSRLGPDHPITIASLCNLGVSLRGLGEVAEAIRILSEAVRRSRVVLPDGHPDHLVALINLAISLRDAGMIDEAMTALDEANVRASNSDLRFQFDQVHAALLADVGRLEEAVTVLREALSRTDLQGQNADQLTTTSNLASLLVRQGRVAEALPLLTQAVSGFEVLHGPDHPRTLSALHNYGTILLETNSSTEAHRILSDVAMRRTRILGSNHPDSLLSRLQASRADAALGDSREALSAYSDLLPDLIRVFGPEHPASLILRESIAEELHRCGDLSASLIAYRELLADVERIMPADSPMVSRVRVAIGENR